MLIRIKDLQKAAEKDLRTGNYKPYERDMKKNELKMKSMYDHLVAGKIDMFMSSGDKSVVCCHRSTREGVLVQYSYGRIINGVFSPSGHVNIRSFKDLLDEDYPSGIWETIKVS